MSEKAQRFLTAYGPKRAVTLECGPGLTKQSFKEDCDINNIIDRFTRTGILDFARENQGSYYDVTGVDFQGSMNMVVKAQELFADLPAQLRHRFHNDPAEFLDFVQRPESRSEAIELGLIDPARESDRSPPPGSRSRRKADSTGGAPSGAGAKAPSDADKAAE